MTYRIAIAFAALTLLASAALAPTAWAQGTASPHNPPPDPFKYLSAKDLLALVDKPGPGNHSVYFGDHENSFVENETRSDVGNEAEVHVHWAHYILILSGDALLTYDGALANPRTTSPGQLRGSGITGGKTVTLHAGDYVQIPAGMPHLFNPPKGTKLHYVVFNTRQ